MNKKFTTVICSDLDYEEMVADIRYLNHTLATITQENGLDKMEIEIYSPTGEIKTWKFDVDELVDAILFAKKRLILMQKLPEYLSFNR